MSNKTLYIMVGCPGSGKTYFAKNHLMHDSRWCYISRDEIRLSLVKDNEKFFSHEKEVYAKFIEQITTALKRNNIDYIIADATHLNWPSRSKLLKALKLKGIDLNTIEIIPVFMDIPLGITIKRNEQRSGRAVVPRVTLEEMASSMTDPRNDNFPYTAIMYVK